MNLNILTTYISKERDKYNRIRPDRIYRANCANTLSRDRQSNKKEFCTKEESFQFRQLVGKLSWLASQSRPDITFGVCMLSSTMKNPKIENVFAANKLLEK